MKCAKRIFLSPPWVDEAERAAVGAAFDSGYVAPCGPLVDRFEQELAACAGRKYAVAVSSGTAALDLIMAHLGVDSTWTVVAPTLTFVATVGPAYHRGARLVFVDCDHTGNIDVVRLEEALACVTSSPETEKGKVLVLGVDLYGRCCDYRAIARLCRRAGAIFVADSAEAVGALENGRPAGSAGLAAVFSFNGNKIVTTSGGGAVLTDSKRLADHVRKLAQQSREACVWYEHKEVGYNYRMSNLLAGVGLAQLKKLPVILEARRRNHAFYREQGLDCLPPGTGNHWLTVALMASQHERDQLLKRFVAANIESRPVWKPMHLQPVFKDVPVFGGDVAADLFARGICLPSGTGLTAQDRERIAACL